MILDLELNSDYNVQVYVYDGEIEIKDALTKALLAISTKNSMLNLSEKTEESEVFILAEIHINEPVINYGPFVINSC